MSKNDPKAQLAKLGWHVYHQVEPRQEVSPYVDKYENQEGHIRVVQGSYKAEKQVGDLRRDEQGSSLNQLLERCLAWENRASEPRIYR